MCVLFVSLLKKMYLCLEKPGNDSNSCYLRVDDQWRNHSFSFLCSDFPWWLCLPLTNEEQQYGGADSRSVTASMRVVHTDSSVRCLLAMRLVALLPEEAGTSGWVHSCWKEVAENMLLAIIPFPVSSFSASSLPFGERSLCHPILSSWGSAQEHDTKWPPAGLSENFPLCLSQIFSHKNENVTNADVL